MAVSAFRAIYDPDSTTISSLRGCIFSWILDLHLVINCLLPLLSKHNWINFVQIRKRFYAQNIRSDNIILRWVESPWGIDVLFQVLDIWISRNLSHTCNLTPVGKHYLHSLILDMWVQFSPQLVTSDLIFSRVSFSQVLWISLAISA